MPVNMESGVSVFVGIEQLLEKEVEEIARDGQEKYVPQPSMSEMLGKLAQKIDFLSEAKPDDQEEVEQSEEKVLVTFQPSLWPWDSIRTKLRNALTEICVLSDVLNIIKLKDKNVNYMVLDAASQPQAAPKPTLQLVGKKKSLASAAEILLQGSNRLSNAVQERTDHMAKQGVEERDYHSELMRLRQRWRLKRSGNMITGDLTYRSAGSQFWNPGLFEVSKATTIDDVLVESDGVQEPLEVTVSSDLAGKAQVCVVIMEGEQQVDRVTLNSPADSLRTKPVVVSWQRKLQQAQSNLFCKELFTQLAHEAYNGGTCSNSSMVIGNEIRSEIFPGTNMCITYSHHKEELEKAQVHDQNTEKEDHSHGVATHVPPLEFALHSLLRKQHRKTKCVPTPRPVTAPQGLGMNKRQRLAGPRALSATELVTASQSETLLDSILKMSRHTVLRRRVAQVLDEVASGFCDPCLLTHWTSLALHTCCHASVHLTSPEMPSLPRSSFHLRVDVTELSIVCTDGTSVTLSSHVPDLRNFIQTQVCRHRVSAAQSIACGLGWHVNHCSHYVGTGQPDCTGSTSGIMVTSPDGHRVVSVRCSPSVSDPVVSVKRSHGDRGTTPGCLTDPKWSALGNDFTEIDWSQMPGKTFAQKFLLLLSASMLV